MSGPWERYQSAPAAGPWTKFQPEAKPSPGQQFLTDLARPAKNALAGFASVADAEQARRADRNARGVSVYRPNEFLKEMWGTARGDLSNGGNALALLFSPISGTLDATAVRPVSRLIAAIPGVEAAGFDEETNAHILNTALMGARPGAGGGPRPPRLPAAPPKAPAGLSRVVKPDGVTAARAETARLREAGVNPTLTDVAGDQGRRVIRAVGAKSSEAGTPLEVRSRQVSASTKPAVIARTRQLTPDQRTTKQAAAETRVARQAQAETDYKGPYQTVVSEPVSAPSRYNPYTRPGGAGGMANPRYRLSDQVLSAINDADGRAAIARALDTPGVTRDRAMQAQLRSLLNGDETTPITAEAMDRVRIAFREMGNAAAADNRGQAAQGYFARMRDLDSTLDGVPQLREVRNNYRQTSQAIDVLEGDVLDPLTTDPADYTRWLQGLSPEARQANVLAIRQQLTDTLGGQRSGPLGSLDQLTTADYAAPNLRAALGSEADGYLNNVAARIEQQRNASMVSPSAGSRTAVLQNDTQALDTAMDIADVGGQLVQGRLGGAARAVADLYRRRGINEAQARTLTELATDPNRLDELLNFLDGNLTREARNSFLRELLVETGRGAAQAIPLAEVSRQAGGRPLE